MLLAQYLFVVSRGASPPQIPDILPHGFCPTVRITRTNTFKTISYRYVTSPKTKTWSNDTKSRFYRRAFSPDFIHFPIFFSRIISSHRVSCYFSQYVNASSSRFSVAVKIHKLWRMIQISQVGKIWGKISPIRTALTQVIRELISPTHTYYLTTKTKIQPFHLLVGWCIINTVRKHHDHKRSVKRGIANQPLWLHLGWPSLHQLLLYVHYYMGHYHCLLYTSPSPRD